MMKIGQENGVIAGFMNTRLFGDMTQSHNDDNLLLGLILTYVDYHV